MEVDSVSILPSGGSPESMESEEAFGKVLEEFLEEQTPEVAAKLRWFVEQGNNLSLLIDICEQFGDPRFVLLNTVEELLNLRQPRPKSDFELWMETEGAKNDNNKTTLEQQLYLARVLYEESEVAAAVPSGADAVMTVEEVIQMLRETPLEVELARWNGIQVDWFLDCFCASPFCQRLQEFGCQLWFIRKVGVIEYLRRQGKHSGPFVDHVKDVVDADGNKVVRETATRFLSYTGRYSFAHFTKMLEQIRGEYIWMDVFCVDQFAWTGRGRDAEMNVFREQLLQQLGEQIRTIKTTSVMLERWDDLMATAGQIWVLWEVFTTVKEKVKLTLMLSKEEHERFVFSFASSSNSFYNLDDVLKRINCEEANAEDPNDKSKILDLIQPSGVFDVNCTVSQYFRDWLLRTAQMHMDLVENRAVDKVPSVALVFLRNNFGSLLARQGHLKEAILTSERNVKDCVDFIGEGEMVTLTCKSNLAGYLMQKDLPTAERIFKEVLDTYSGLHGDQDVEFLNFKCKLVDVLVAAEKLGEAEIMQREIARGYENFIGGAHPRTVHAVRTLQEILRHQNKLAEADVLAREISQLQQRLPYLKPQHLVDSSMNAEQFRKEMSDSLWLQGKDHPNTLVAMSNMAYKLQLDEKLDEAECLFREANDIAKQCCGDDRPESAIVFLNFATFLCKERGMQVEALPLHRQALSTFRKLYHEHHSVLLKSVHNLGLCLLELEQFEEAEELITEALIGRNKSLGSEHEDTFVAASSLAEALRRQKKYEQAEEMCDRWIPESVRCFGKEASISEGLLLILTKIRRAQGKLKENEALFFSKEDSKPSKFSNKLGLRLKSCPGENIPEEKYVVGFFLDVSSGDVIPSASLMVAGGFLAQESASVVEVHLVDDLKRHRPNVISVSTSKVPIRTEVILALFGTQGLEMLKTHPYLAASTFPILTNDETLRHVPQWVW